MTGMGLEKFPHPQSDMGIPTVSYYYHGDGSEESIPDGNLPIAILGRAPGQSLPESRPSPTLLPELVYIRLPIFLLFPLGFFVVPTRGWGPLRSRARQ
jgi:hypothetical protein